MSDPFRGASGPAAGGAGRAAAHLDADERGGHHPVVQRVVRVGRRRQFLREDPVPLVQRLQELVRGVDVQRERLGLGEAEPRERQAGAVVQVFVRGEEIQRAVAAVGPPAEDGRAEFAQAAAHVEDEDVAFASLDLAAGGFAAVDRQVGQADALLVLGRPGVGRHPAEGVGPDLAAGDAVGQVGHRAHDGGLGDALGVLRDLTAGGEDRATPLHAPERHPHVLNGRGGGPVGVGDREGEGLGYLSRLSHHRVPNPHAALRPASRSAGPPMRLIGHPDAEPQTGRNLRTGKAQARGQKSDAHVGPLKGTRSDNNRFRPP